ncbi:MAG: glycosyltransferase family 2 protein, partial [Desulfomonilaceae bacterium]
SGGMPLYKYISKRVLTLVENFNIGSKLSEFHSGYRAFSRKCLENLPLNQNSDDFLFDNEMIAQAIFFDFNVGEISCPTRYFPEASSINFRRSVIYGLGVIWTALRFRLQKWGYCEFKIFSKSNKNLPLNYYKQILP